MHSGVDFMMHVRSLNGLNKVKKIPQNKVSRAPEAIKIKGLIVFHLNYFLKHSVTRCQYFDSLSLGRCFKKILA